MARRVRPHTSPEDHFSTLAEALLADPRVSEGRMFGSQGLKVGGKVFAMLVRGRLVVKLPAQRVKALVGAGVGDLFDPGHGRVLKEWITISSGADVDWLALAREAKDYLGGEAEGSGCFQNSYASGHSATIAATPITSCAAPSGTKRAAAMTTSAPATSHVS